MAQLKDLLVNGDSRFVGNVYSNTPKIAYGTCATAAATAAKEIVVDDPTWNLQVGDIIGIKFTNSNSASNVTFNVNGTGAIGISYNTSRPYTGSSTLVCGYANRTLFYQYDGTYWHWFHGGYDANDNTYTSAYCSTAAGTAAKVASCTNYNLLDKSYLHIIMTTANTVQGAITLNVNSKGAKPIYINGAASSASNYTLPAGSYIIYYDGTNYYFRTDGKIENVGGSDVSVTQALTSGTEIGTITVEGAGTKLYAPTPLSLGTSSSTAYRGDYGNTAYSHATDSSRLTTATSSGFYKVAATAQGHIASLTAVAKADITGLGIPGSDTNYYPTTWTWTAGTTSGPTASITGSGMSAVSVGAIPAANGTTASGIVTTSAQTFGGVKTFSSAPKLSTNTLTTSSGNTVTIPDAASTLVNLSSSQALTNKTYNGYTLAGACAKAVDTSISAASTSANLPTSAAVASFVEGKGYITSYTDTKNTAGSTDSSSKLFIIGATSQAANPQTYSQDTAYVGTDGHLYSNSIQVVNLSGSQALTNKTYNGYTLAAACAKAVVTSVDTSASLPTSGAVKTYVDAKPDTYSGTTTPASSLGKDGDIYIMI